MTRVLDEVIRVCKAEGISVYLTSGTLLGAVRHGGFIPWDDDVDVAIPRKDFNRFVSLAPKVLGPSFALGWTNTEASWYHPFAKVYSRDTEFVERLGPDTLISTGIFVDIYPLDYASGNLRAARRKYRIRTFATTTAVAARTGAFSRNRGTRLLQKALLGLLGPNRLIDLSARYLSLHGKKRCYVNYASYYVPDREMFPLSCFAPAKLRFGEREYPVPAGYDTVLRTLYGDYSQLPPVEKRVAHHPVRVRFPDGEVMDFEKMTAFQQEAAV